ncbi:MAG: hypothetical protein L0Z62_00775 [Gemmataceae bacterium]|nr:hypothetical protein [Gemmataceae bacterium]
MNRTTWWKRKAEQRLQAQRRPSRQPQIEELEERCLLDGSGFRPIDEIGNNVANPNLGTANTQLLRQSPAAYRPVANGGDGLNTPSMHYAAPNFVAGPRLVSNDVHNQATVLFGSTDINTVNGNSLSGFGYTWGQFLDHDMDLSPDQGGLPQPPAPNTNRDGGNGFPIPSDPTHPGDPIGSLAFSRSIFDPATGNLGPDGITGTADDVPRQQINVSTSFLDLSQVYGSTLFVADALRSHVNGQLKTSPGNMLPFNSLAYFTQAQLDALHMANDAHLVQNSELFAAGDVRANETIELASLHTLFLRNHNRLASQLHVLRPSWGDEQLYQTARKINIAQMQFITYTQYLPSLLGPGAIPLYSGYDPTVNPSISTEFSTIAFRFGHSLLNNTVPRHANDGSSIGDVSLAQNFFNPRLLNPNGVIDPLTGLASSDIGPVLKGDADISAQAMDVMAVSGIRNLLFGQGGPGEDLMARDIWRADDHGIGTYNQVLITFGLPPIMDTGVSAPGEPFRFHGFEQISSDPAVVQKLILAFTGPTREAFLANGKFAGDINPFVAGLAEDHVPGSDLGPLFHKILVDQFTRLRDGDRFYFLNEQWSAVELLLGAQGITLGLMIQTNTNASNLQLNVFKFQASISGTVFGTGGSRLSGITVVLTDDEGHELARTVTDSQGRYRFDQLSGPAAEPTDPSGVSQTGRYRVSLLLPSGQVTHPDTITIDMGNDNVTGVNFSVNL